MPEMNNKKPTPKINLLKKNPSVSRGKLSIELSKNFLALMDKEDDSETLTDEEAMEIALEAVRETRKQKHTNKNLKEEIDGNLH